MSITPLEQFANPILYLPLPLIYVGISKITLYAMITTSLVTAIFIFPVLNTFSLVGTRWLVMVESMYSSLTNVVNSQIGEGHSEYAPIGVSLFMFILVANLVSNVPYGFAITTSIIISLGLSISLWIGFTSLGLHTHGIHWFSFFVPAGTPLALVPLLVLIETISYVARAFSLGVRLLSNLCAGHILILVLATMLWGIMTTGLLYAVIGVIPFSIFTALIGLEVAVSLIQSFVFTLLFASYLNDAINLH